jgi:tryptophanyl-tRNA synthetase
MSLTDPTAKMSKSDPSPRSRILLNDQPDDILKKVKAAVTDTGSEVAYDWEEKPGISNLLELFSFFSGRTIPDLTLEFGSAGYGAFKTAVGESIAEGLRPIREVYANLTDSEVSQVMESSAATARDRAEISMHSIREKAGLL